MYCELKLGMREKSEPRFDLFSLFQIKKKHKYTETHTHEALSLGSKSLGF